MKPSSACKGFLGGVSRLKLEALMNKEKSDEAKTSSMKAGEQMHFLAKNSSQHIVGTDVVIEHPELSYPTLRFFSSVAT